MHTVGQSERCNFLLEQTASWTFTDDEQMLLGAQAGDFSEPFDQQIESFLRIQPANGEDDWFVNCRSTNRYALIAAVQQWLDNRIWNDDDVSSASFLSRPAGTTSRSGRSMLTIRDTTIASNAPRFYQLNCSNPRETRWTFLWSG